MDEADVMADRLQRQTAGKTRRIVAIWEGTAKLLEARYPGTNETWGSRIAKLLREAGG